MSDRSAAIHTPGGKANYGELGGIFKQRGERHLKLDRSSSPQKQFAHQRIHGGVGADPGHVIHKFVSHEGTVYFVTDEGDSVAAIADRQATDCEQIIAANANNEGGLIRQHTCFGKKYLLQWPVERGR